MFRIITLNHKQHENTVWCTGETIEDFKVFMQYVIDSCSAPETFILENVETRATYDAYKIATELYGLKKRTFDERMHGGAM